MKIIQINSWLGRLNGPLERFLAKESPDIVCLQEVFYPRDEDLPTFHDQYGFLGEIQRQAALDHLHFSPAWGFKLAGAKIDVGIAILSKHELSNQNEFHVSNEYYTAEKVSDYRRNTRVFQSAAIHIQDKLLTVANYQGYLAGEHASGDEISESLMGKVKESLSVLPRPLIFCGDFNVAPETPTMAVLDGLNFRNLIAETDEKTTLSEMHRAPLPDRHSVVCDYILISDDISVKEFKVSNEVVSDHKALILEFDL